MSIYKSKGSSKIVLKLFLNYVLSIGSFSWVLRIDWYQKFPKILSKSWSKSIAKLMSSEKCNFARVKLWNRNFYQLRMIVFDLGYLLLGWFCCSKYDSRENPWKHRKIRNHFNFSKLMYIIHLNFCVIWIQKQSQILKKYIVWLWKIKMVPDLSMFSWVFSAIVLATTKPTQQKIAKVKNFHSKLAKIPVS